MILGKNKDGSDRCNGFCAVEGCGRRKAEEAWEWANSLDSKKLHWMVTTLADDIYNLAPENRKAVLQVVAYRMGRQLIDHKDWDWEADDDS